MTHVERVQAHFNNKCAKRACQSTVAINFPSALSDSVQDQFEKMLALWPYSMEMVLNKVAHDSCATALKMLHLGAKVPSQHALRGLCSTSAIRSRWISCM
ncbi:Transposase [Phytophthora megakarya]|uniref:Transposase n=1 Tax=Phytophthora megakarya TaxID=4795 RepID=A0A225V6A3_9STRA|nr:Transposase [Phytophthora megakarya]